MRNNMLKRTKEKFNIPTKRLNEAFPHIHCQCYLPIKYCLDYIHTFCENNDVIVFGITAIVSFCVYINSVAPSIVGGDSGELVAEGCQLGTSHPPGYPLYTILVYLVTNLGHFLDEKVNGNFGIRYGANLTQSPAYFVNVMSCCFGACVAHNSIALKATLNFFDLTGGPSASQLIYIFSFAL